jgi:hypothetical protein
VGKEREERIFFWQRKGFVGLDEVLDVQREVVEGEAERERERRGEGGIGREMERRGKRIF